MNKMNKDGSSSDSRQIPGWIVAPIVDAACCIANNNRNLDGTRMFDTVKKFGGESSALGRYVRERLREKGNRI